MDASEQEEITSADSWAQEELGRADFGDKRLTKRFIQITSDIAAQPEGSVPQACGSEAAVRNTITSPLLTHKLASSLSLIRIYILHFIDAYLCPNLKLTHKPARKSRTSKIPRFPSSITISCLNLAENCVNMARKGFLSNFADLNCGMLKVCPVFHHSRFLETIHWLGLPIFVLVFPLQSVFTLIEDSNLEKIELCATIHAFFNEL